MPSPNRPTVELYGASYEGFAARLYADIRAETYGEDIGQTSWTDAAELATFSSWLQLERRGDPVLLDAACGSGGPALRIASLTGCRVRGIDSHAAAVQAAQTQADKAGLGDRASFEQVDASLPLPFPDSAFDAITCIDAILHLPGRPQVLAEWARVLRPGGRLVFTDPVVVSGAVNNEELAIRSSIGFFLFVPPGHDEALIAASGLELVTKEDRTENMAIRAGRWRGARQQRAAELRRLEGDATFEGQQRFLEVTSRLAAERRLSRWAFCAQRAHGYTRARLVRSIPS